MKKMFSGFNSVFSFNKADPGKISFETKRLDFKKVQTSNDISTQIIKQFSSSFETFLLKFLIFNNKFIFLDDLKHGEFVPVFQKGQKNYAPIPVLFNICKKFERC